MMVLVAILNLAAIGGIGWLIFRRSHDRLFWPALMFKLLCGVLLGALYQFHYGYGDTLTYFSDATQVLDQYAGRWGDLVQYWWQEPILEGEWNGEARSVFMMKWVVLAALLTGKNYWLSSLWFSFVSFLAAWYAYRSIVKGLAGSRPAAALALLFFPSMVFWSSGIIKETLAMAGLLFSAGLLLRWYLHLSIRRVEWVLLLVALWLLWSLKYYWAAVFTAVALPTVLVHLFFNARKAGVQLILWLCLLVVMFGIVTRVHPNFHLDRIAGVVYANYEAFAKLSRPDQLIDMSTLEPTFTSLILHAPLALWAALFRPGVWEIHNPVQALAAVENLGLLLLVITGLWHIRRYAWRWPLLLLATGCYIIVLASFLALSTPNLGTLSRYREGLLPFFVFLCCYGHPALDALLKRWPGFAQLRR